MSSSSLFRIQIPRRLSHCCLCEGPFSKGKIYHSVVHTEDGDPKRQDYCVNCWEQVSVEVRQAQGQHWKGQVPEKETANDEDLSQEERALTLLKNLLAEEEKSATEEAFVLALFLAREKRLVRRSENESVIEYEDLASSEFLRVARIDIESLQVEALQERLAKKLYS